MKSLSTSVVTDALRNKRSAGNADIDLNMVSFVDIAVQVSSEGAIPTLVCLQSIAEQWKNGRTLRLWVMGEGNGRDLMPSVEAIVKAVGGEAHWVTVPAQGVLTGLAELLPQVNRVVFLSGECLLHQDLGTLWERDLGQGLALAVPHRLGSFDSVWEENICAELNVSGRAPYFDVSLLVADLGRWRQESIASACARVLKDAYRLHGSEEAALNVVLSGRWHGLSQDWNYRLPPYRGFPPAPLAVSHFPPLVRFAEFQKPWRYQLPRIISAGFLDCYRRAPFDKRKFRLRAVPSLAALKQSLRVVAAFEADLFERRTGRAFELASASNLFAYAREHGPGCWLNFLFPSRNAGWTWRKVNHVLAWFKTRVVRPTQYLALHPEAEYVPRLSQLLPSHFRGPDFFFVQVGAFDGREGDQIFGFARRYGWKGVLVEPQPLYFKKLCQNYAGREGLSFINAAIGPKNGTLPFYVMDESAAGQVSWAPQLGSFIRANLVKHGTDKNGLESAVREIQVETITFDSLLDRHGVKTIDLLQIDTEGYDFEILKSVPFDRVRPLTIRFEHVHLSASDRYHAYRYLAAQGYKMMPIGNDTVAVLTSPPAPVAQPAELRSQQAA